MGFADYVLCAECDRELLRSKTIPWKSATRICPPCLERHDHPELTPPVERQGPFCSYCNSADGIETCCSDHAHTLICKWCRPGRPKRHKSPFEGMSL
jgi:hypothetical protein